MKRNFFNIENPDEWICNVQVYMPGHSSLQIVIHRPQTGISRYLNFLGVDYLDCPIVWQGANFELADTTECLKLLRLTNRHARRSDESLLEDYALFVARIANTTSDYDIFVRIIAAPASSLSEEDYFRPEPKS